EELGLDVLIDDLETAVARGTFYPVLPVCAETGVGLAELLEILSGGFPSPSEIDLPETQALYGIDTKAVECNPSGPLLAEVVRTTVDPYLGRLSILRLFSGTLTPESAIHISGHGGASRGTRTPVSSSCGAWAKRMPTSCSSGCARPVRTSIRCRCASRSRRRSPPRRAATDGW